MERREGEPAQWVIPTYAAGSMIGGILVLYWMFPILIKYKSIILYVAFLLLMIFYGVLFRWFGKNKNKKDKK